jgi:hypothetical protein
MPLQLIVGLFVRHFFTALGGALVAHGYADPGVAEEIAGGAVALVGVVLSYVNKKRLSK